MYAGQVVERGDGRRVFGEPAHPYTGALLGGEPAVARPPAPTAAVDPRHRARRPAAGRPAAGSPAAAADHARQRCRDPQHDPAAPARTETRRACIH